MRKLILIDGNAIMHRAFHALPPLTNSDGVMVNAVFGFFSMFLKIIEDQKPDHIVVCFDRKAPTFRKSLYAGYQAHRPTMSEDLGPQIGLVHEVLVAAKVEIFEVDGYEADDLIGTIAAQSQTRSCLTHSLNNSSEPSGNTGLKHKNKSSLTAVKISKNISKETMKNSFREESRDLEVFIVSGDRDLLQLVNHRVKMIAPITGLTNMIVFDSVKVREKYGIEPSQVVDYKALVGDASDNYPGVAGVGPKTASTLLNEYKNLENIYKHLEDIKLKNPGLALKLANGAEAAGLAQKLAGVVLDAPITLDIEKSSIGYFDKERLKKEFEKYNFKSLLKRLSSSAPVSVKKNLGVQSSMFD
jgi:DNA polymerase I